MNFDDVSPTILIIIVSLVFGLIFGYLSKISEGKKGIAIVGRLLRLHTKLKIINWKKRNCKNHNFEGHLDKKCLKFFGFGSDGTALSIEFSSFGMHCDTYFVLKLKNKVLQHGFKATITENIYEDSITVGDLTLQQIEPFKKWRITFNGISPKSNFVDECIADNCEQTQHVIFTFFWTAASDPIEWPNDWNPTLLTTIFAKTEVDDHLNDLLSSGEGFDQFGSLFGQVSINDNISKELIELNLPGVRMVRDLKDNNQRTVYNSLKTWTLVGTCKDGFVITLSAKEIGNIPTVYMGAARKPNMNVYSIEATDFNFKKVENEITEIIFNLKAGEEKFQGTLHTLMLPMKIMENRETIKFQQYVSFELNGQPGFGTIITTSTQEKFKPLKTLITSTPKMKVSKIVAIKAYTLFFSDVEAQNEEFSGGKGASLAYLTKLIENKSLYDSLQSDFIIPPGFILTTAAFGYQVLKHERLQYAIETLEKNTRHSDTIEKLHFDCEIVQKLFTDLPLEEEIIESVKVAYKNLLINSKGTSKFAVRSSAVGEDGVESSSAGQNETFLGLQSCDDILLAIQKCWASLFSVQSVTYRVQNVQPIRTAMAVVIQAMVSPESAGVLFTSHPSKNDPSKLLITANYGLCETVVSGSIDPDVFVIQRSYNNKNFKIIERSLGSKTHLIQMSSNESKILEFPVSDEDRLKLCVSDENLLKLCEIGNFLQEINNSPRDIEWALHKDQIYLLQSRPMTSKNVFSSWELLHEFDTAVMSDEDMFTFGNVGEVMAQIMTPLTTSILIPSFEKGLLKNFPLAIESIHFNQLMNVSSHRLTLNVFMVFMQLVKKEISIENRAHGIAIFGKEFVTDEIHRLAKHRFGLASKSLEMQYIWNVIRASWNGNRKVRELEKFIAGFNGNYSRSNLEQFSSPMELYDDISVKLKDHFSYVQSIHGLTTMLTTCFQIIMFSILSEGKTDLSTKSMRDISILLSSCTDAESAEIPVMLEEIANTIMKCDITKNEFCSINPSKGKEWMQNNCVTAYTLFEQFLDKHSHRGLQEFDIGYETWGMCNELVIEMLQNSIKNLQLNGTIREKKTKRSNEEILTELKTSIRSSTRRLLGYLLPRCHKYVQLREKTKSILIAYINEIRNAFIHLGKEMKMHGYLPDQKLIFYLTQNEIGKLLANRNRNAHLVNKAIRRRRLFPEWNKMQYDEFQWGIIKPKDREGEVEKSILKVNGTPVSEGILIGRVCVVKSFSEVSKIKRGDILIAYSTDIAWSPYFPILSGVVTELGGLISHGAVVAREYGLPCIVGATNATSIFSDDDVVHLDANNGIISKIEQN